VIVSIGSSQGGPAKGGIPVSTRKREKRKRGEQCCLLPLGDERKRARHTKTLCEAGEKKKKKKNRPSFESGGDRHWEHRAGLDFELGERRGSIQVPSTCRHGKRGKRNRLFTKKDSTGDSDPFADREGGGGKEDSRESLFSSLLQERGGKGRAIVGGGHGAGIVHSSEERKKKEKKKSKWN